MDLFLSEIHVGNVPPGTGLWTTQIRLRPRSPVPPPLPRFVRRAGEAELDEDGDFCLERRCWTIHHYRETTLSAVGGQIWRGSCLLSNFVLSYPELFRGKAVVELGCGVGLVGIALTDIAHQIYLTDRDLPALELSQQNVQRNAAATSSHIRIRRLDWDSLESILATQRHPERDETVEEGFEWMEADLEGLRDVDVFLAADVIYDEPLTEAFFHALEQLMRFSHRPCVCYLTLEKRFNFTIADLDVTCPAYNHFLSFLQTADSSQPPSKIFKAEKISADPIPRVLDVELSGDEELWKISLVER